MRRPGIPAALALVAGAVCAQAPDASGSSWGLSAAAMHRRLAERADDGSRLLTERGALLRLALDAHLPLPGGGALRPLVAVASGNLDYAGRTQGGAALDTVSGHRDFELQLAWRPLPAARWGEGWLVLQGLQQRRQIASTTTVGGLRETSTLWMSGLRWSHAFRAGGWQWEPALELSASVHHRLAIHYGGLFDASALEGGRRRSLAVGLSAAPDSSPWQLGLQWSRARQSASTRQPLLRGGAPAGTVRQPRLESDDLSLSVRRSF